MTKITIFENKFLKYIINILTRPIDTKDVVKADIVMIISYQKVTDIKTIYWLYTFQHYHISKSMGAWKLHKKES